LACQQDGERSDPEKRGRQPWPGTHQCTDQEPFYPSADEAWQYSGDARIIAQLTGAKGATQIEVREFESALKQHQKIMLVIGQGRLSEVLIESLATIQANYSWVIIGDILSNIHLLKIQSQNTISF
jgi:hypothetical protein